MWTVLNMQLRRVFGHLGWILSFVFGWLHSGGKFGLGGLHEKFEYGIWVTAEHKLDPDGRSQDLSDAYPAVRSSDTNASNIHPTLPTSTAPWGCSTFRGKAHAVFTLIIASLPLKKQQDDRKLRWLNSSRFKVCKSVHHHTIPIIQPNRYKNFSSLLLDVYVQLNMFRASSRPSPGAQQLR